MPNSSFQFKQFTIYQDKCAMKITTDSCLFGAITAAAIQNKNYPALRILDIGTGTGLLSLMIVQKNNQAIIDALEIDKDACFQAKENISASSFKERINILHGDAREFISENRYDIIISNPPFYANELKSGNTKKDTAHHSNELGLGDLLDVTRRNINTATGRFFLLLPYKRNDEIKTLLKKKGAYLIAETLLRQSVKHKYFRIIIEASFTIAAEEVSKEISIKNKDDKYTAEFTELLKDYYLYL
jgi:tRNA1Val (adenine37-N6)-methyltransferase